MPQSSEAKKKPRPSSLQLWPEQQAVYDFAITRPATAIFSEQRTGKTYITLAILRRLAGDPINLHTGEGNDFCGLLVTLLTNRDSTWLDGIQTHLKWLNVTSDWEEFKKLPNPKVLLIHYEMLIKLINKLVKYKKFNWACADEAQRLASRGNQSSRAMARLSWIERKLVLTGTPQEGKSSKDKKGNQVGHGGETDYFGIFKFLGPEVFGSNWEQFERHFMEWPKIDFKNAPKGSALWQKKTLQQRILKNKATFREDRRKELLDLLKPYCIRLTQEEAGIAKAVVHKVSLEMTRHQKKIYEDMLRDSFAYLPIRGKNSNAQKRVTAPLEITNIAKRRQIATGFVYDDDGSLHDIGTVKIDKTIEMVARLPKPIVVFTAFRPDNDLVYEALVGEGYDVVQVNGSTKKKLRPQIWRDFQRGQYDVAVVQTKTGGTGVDLWKASKAIVYSMTHSYRDWDQLKARLSVRGRSKPPEFFVLCSKNTIDEELFDLVIVKKFNTERTLKHLKRGKSSWQRNPLQPPKKLPKSRPRKPPSSVKRRNTV